MHNVFFTRTIKGTVRISFCSVLFLQEGIKRAEGLIGVMTPEERREPRLLLSDPTASQRLRRIAKDAGVKLSAVSVSLLLAGAHSPPDLSRGSTQHPSTRCTESLHRVLTW